MYTEKQITNLLKDLGELYSQNARLRLNNETLISQNTDLIDLLDRINTRPEPKSAEKKSKSKKEAKLFKEESKPVTNNLTAFIGDRLDNKGD